MRIRKDELGAYRKKKADNGTYRDIFSAKEIRSLLYYQNAGKNIVLSDNEKHLEKFYSIENAYEVINMLMFDDIGSEQVRLSAEGRWMDPDILNNMNELLDVYCNLYSAICKYTYLIKKEQYIRIGMTDVTHIFT